MSDNTAIPLVLIRRSQGGDQQAFTALFEQYKNLVFRTAYLMLGNTEDAEDALQEVFLQVYRAIDSYQAEKATFTTWLYRITVNHCLNRRRRQLPITLPLESPFSPLRGGDPVADNPWEEYEAVRQCVLRLNVKLRAVVVLRYFGELSYAEIAQSLEIPLGTVKSRLQKALRILQKALRKNPSFFFADGETTQ
jgi:RNA polymerase sigma-70 factor (ECF subfamily)